MPARSLNTWTDCPSQSLLLGQIRFAISNWYLAPHWRNPSSIYPRRLSVSASDPSQFQALPPSRGVPNRRPCPSRQCGQPDDRPNSHERRLDDTNVYRVRGRHQHDNARPGDILYQEATTRSTSGLDAKDLVLLELRHHALSITAYYGYHYHHLAVFRTTGYYFMC